MPPFSYEPVGPTRLPLLLFDSVRAQVHLLLIVQARALETGDEGAAAGGAGPC